MVASHEITDEHRMKRVEDFRENVMLFPEEKWRLCDVVTGDESCFFYWQIWSRARLRFQFLNHRDVKS